MSANAPKEKFQWVRRTQKNWASHPEEFGHKIHIQPVHCYILLQLKISFRYITLSYVFCIFYNVFWFYVSFQSYSWFFFIFCILWLYVSVYLLSCLYLLCCFLPLWLMKIYITSCVHLEQPISLLRSLQVASHSRNMSDKTNFWLALSSLFTMTIANYRVTKWVRVK